MIECSFRVGSSHLFPLEANGPAGRVRKGLLVNIIIYAFLTFFRLHIYQPLEEKKTREVKENSDPIPAED